MFQEVGKCCEQQVPHFHKGAQSTLCANVTKIKKDSDGYPDGWYLLIGFHVIFRLEQCIFCHKKLD